MIAKNRVTTYAFLVVFIALTAIIGAVILIYNENKVKGYVRVDATVVGYEKRYDYDDEQWMYREKVEFIVDGKTYEATNEVWSNAPKSIGKTIEIAYDPNNPNNNEFVKSKNIFSLVLFLMSGVGVIGLVAQVVMDVKAKKRKDEYEHNLIA